MPDSATDYALVGSTLGGQENNEVIYFLDNRGSFLGGSFAKEDRRILVERTVTPRYGAVQTETERLDPVTVPTKTTIEVEAPVSLFIRFVLKFR